MISVVVLNYNGLRYLERCLSSLLAQTYSDFEVIVVDNGSSDDSVNYIESHYPQVTVVKNSDNLGFSGGTNVGIARAKGDYILTLNNDTYLDQDFLKHIIKPMLYVDSVGMCASKMIFPDGRINSTGICLSRSGAAWNRGMFEVDRGQYEASIDIFGPCAGAALYRKKMLEEVGLFDEDFFLYMEDVDLAFRAKLAGWGCTYVHKAVAFHIHGGTAGFGSDLSVYYGNRNIVWYVLKDFPRWLLLSSLLWIVGRNLAVIPYYAARGQGKVILKSKIDALRGAPKMLRKRRQIVRKISDREVAKYVKTWFCVFCCILCYGIGYS